MASTRSTRGTLALVALALGTWVALRRDLRSGWPLTVQKRRGVTHIALALLLRFEAMQAGIDRISRAPNLGALASAVAAPAAAISNLRLYDELMDASRHRRRWHQLYPLGVGTVLAVCWWPGVPHDRSLHWQLSGFAREESNRWRSIFELLSMATLTVPCTEGALASQRIVLHLYATGNDRALCYSLAWGTLSVLAGTLSVQAAVRLVSGQDRFLIPLGVQQGVALGAFAAQTAGALAPRWSLGQTGGPVRNGLERRVERLLRGLLVISCYEDVRRLAFALQDAVPRRPARLRYDETRLGHIYQLAELELLLQMFKTTINDARLILAGYVDADGITPGAQPGAGAAERAARVLANALDNFMQGHIPSTVPTPDNPLRDAVSFNDDRFLAAVWQAYRRYARPGFVAHGKPRPASR